MLKPAPIIAFNNKNFISAIGLSTPNNGKNTKSNIVQNISEKLFTKIKIKEIGHTLTLLGSNVCTISDKQFYRRIVLKRIFGEAQPDIIILVETNLESLWNPYPAIYSDFKTQNNKNCGVLILAKKDLLPCLVDVWENKGICISLEKIGTRVIGLYTPYYADYKTGEKMLMKWKEKNKWIAFGDHENMIKKFANYGEFNFVPEYSRQVNGKKSTTDAFYGNLLINGGKIWHKICDHYILTCNLELGCRIIKRVKSEYKRKEIIFWTSKRNSKLYKNICEFWPKIPLSHLLTNLVKMRKSKQSIWIPNVNYNSTKTEI